MIIKTLFILDSVFIFYMEFLIIFETLQNCPSHELAFFFLVLKITF